MKKNTITTAARKLTTVTGMAIFAIKPVLFFLVEWLTGGMLLTVGVKSARFQITSGIQRKEKQGSSYFVECIVLCKLPGVALIAETKGPYVPGAGIQHDPFPAQKKWISR